MKTSKWNAPLVAVAALWAVQAMAAGAQPAKPLVAVAGEAQPAAVASSTAGESLTLEEFLQRVRQHSPALRTQGVRQDMERADIRTAGVWANPSLSVSRQPGEKEAGLSQPVPIFGQTALRVEQARLASDTGRAQRASDTVDVLDQAAQRFTELLVRQEQHTVRQRAAEDMARAAKVVQGQIEAGARSRYDGARITLQQAQMASTLRQSEADLQAARAAVAELVAQPGWQMQAMGSLRSRAAQEGVPALATLWEQARQQLPALQAAHAHTEQAAQKVRLEQREALPTPSFGISRVRNHETGSYNVVSVSVDIPLFDRKTGVIERARLEHQQAEIEEEATQTRARMQLEQAWRQMQLRSDSVRAYERQGLEQLQSLREMAQDAYRLGQSSILEWMEAMNSLTEHRLQHLELVQQMLQAEWALRVASGQLPGTPQ